MKSVTSKKREGLDHRPHMGSEYTDAPTWVAQRPRVGAIGASRKKTNNEPQHGSNDSDFGGADQTQD